MVGLSQVRNRAQKGKQWGINLSERLRHIMIESRVGGNFNFFHGVRQLITTQLNEAGYSS